MMMLSCYGIFGRSFSSGVPSSRSGNWKSALMTIGLMGGIYYATTSMKPVNKNAGNFSIANTTIETVGKPRLGGPWTLIDGRSGQPITSDCFKGKFQLLYFGFTFCPDICPQELEKLAQAILLAKKDLPNLEIVPIFVTVDPKRDTVAQVDQYAKEFGPGFIGLTGTPEAIKKITRKFRVYFNNGVKATDEDYLIDHSIIHYLVGPDGNFIDFFGKSMTAEEIANKIKQHAKEFRNERRAAVSDGETKPVRQTVTPASLSI